MTDPQTAADLKKKRTFRTFSYRGVELDKLLDLSNEEVSVFSTTAMTCSNCNLYLVRGSMSGSSLRLTIKTEVS